MTNNIFIHFILWLSFLLFISFFLRKLWSVIVSGRKLQFLVFPGVLVHEFSHVVGCLLSGSKVEELSLFSSKGSYVRSGKPKIPILGKFIIGLSPIAGGIAFIYILFRLFNFSIPEIIIEDSFIVSIFGIFKEIVNLIIDNINLWFFWIFLYLLISTIISLSPSSKDIKNSFISIVLVIVIVFLIIQFNFFDTFITETILMLISITSLGVFFGLMSLLVTLPLFILKKLF